MNKFNHYRFGLTSSSADFSGEPKNVLAEIAKDIEKKVNDGGVLTLNLCGSVPYPSNPRLSVKYDVIELGDVRVKIFAIVG